VSAAASCAVIDAVPNRACDDVEIRDLNGDIDAAFVQSPFVRDGEDNALRLQNMRPAAS
jgi:hypothetical protein